MEIQRSLPQMKEQEKSLEKELNEMETSSPPDTEFKTMIRGMLKELGGRMGEISKNFKKKIVSIKKNIKTIKNNQSEMKNTISEIKNLLERAKSRLMKQRIKSGILRTK